MTDPTPYPALLAELQADLDLLEATDPDVARAAARYDAMSAKIRAVAEGRRTNLDTFLGTEDGR